MLKNKTAYRQVFLVLNAAAALVAAGKAANLEEGIKKAEASIDTGAAAAKLEQLVEYTRKNG